MNPRHPIVARRAGGRCEYCRAPELVFNFAHEVDHVILPGAGGTSDPSNLALACRACNSFKRERTTGFDEVTEEEVPLYNPRSDTWSDHFEFDSATRLLLGRTAIGRATITRLDMNHAYQVAARGHWVLMGQFP